MIIGAHTTISSYLTPENDIAIQQAYLSNPTRRIEQWKCVKRI